MSSRDRNQIKEKESFYLVNQKQVKKPDFIFTSGGGDNKRNTEFISISQATCNAGDPGLIPGSGRTTGEGIGYPLQYS